jgi:hypothetical protein
MVVSINPDPHKKEFVDLLDSTIQELNNHAKIWPNKVQQLKGYKLEPYVKDIMSDLALGSPFENSIELIGGQKFPDIVAKKYYGVEVKTTTQNHWKTTGNSVLESTRIEDVERVFMLFGKLGKPIEFRYRAYEECLSEVVVTHSPRYLIDMNLNSGHTIFDKIKISYDDLRSRKNPIKPITDYYKSKLKPGQDLWWIDNQDEKANSFIINIWNNLSAPDQQFYANKAMILFPEIFSSRQDKYNRFAIWLVKNEGIVCPNVRDTFTAKGRANITINGKEYIRVPRIFINLFENIDSILKLFPSIPSSELSDSWGIKVTKTDKLLNWIKLVSKNSKSVRDTEHLDIEEILKNYLL